MRRIARYPVDSLQIYFAASLEIQEELIRYGFQVPVSRDRKIKIPIPIIYSNFRGWIEEPGPLTIERVIPPEWYGKSPEQLGWIDLGEIYVERGVGRQVRRAFRIPPEEVYLDIFLNLQGDVYLKLEIRGYHLERTSIRQVDPARWNNWAAFYIDASYLTELLELVGREAGVSRTVSLHVAREDLQGGKEITYYASIPLTHFSLCLGCFALALSYFEHKAGESGLGRDVVHKLRLRLNHNPDVSSRLKVGVAKVRGKRRQVMFKLASEGPIKRIRGVLKPEVEGKARGEIVYCDHANKDQIIVVNAELLFSALKSVAPRLRDLPER